MSVLGLSLGSHYSALAVLSQEGNAEIIANEDGDHLTPSVVAFGAEEEFSGSQAKAQEGRNAVNTITEFTSLLGASSADAAVKEQKARHPFRIEEASGKPQYRVTRANDKEETYSVTDVTAKFLSRLRESAQAVIGSEITGVCVTVPASSSPAAIAALKEAAVTAGLPLLQLIHEPAAAILAYQAGQSPAALRQKDVTTVVADFGGSVLRVSVVAVRGGTSTIITSTEEAIGGSSLDDLLIKHFAAEFKRKHSIDITGNARAEGKLRAEVERTKKTLSASTSAPCSVESLAQGFDFSSTLNRMRFELMSSKVFSAVLSAIESTIAKASLRPDQIQEVILAGGSMRIPKIQARIASLFPASTAVRSEISPDEVLARGAAVQAGLLSDYQQEDAALLEAALKEEARKAPHLVRSIGVVDAVGAFHPILAHHTPIPARRTLTASATDGAVFLAIYEGETDAPAPEDEEEAKPAPVERTLLAELALTGLEASEEVEITFQVVEAGEVRVAVRGLSSGKTEAVVIPHA